MKRKGTEIFQAEGGEPVCISVSRQQDVRDSWYRECQRRKIPYVFITTHISMLSATLDCDTIYSFEKPWGMSEAGYQLIRTAFYAHATKKSWLQGGKTFLTLMKFPKEHVKAIATAFSLAIKTRE